MAKIRNINTKLWDDEFIFGLGPDGKLLFVYLLTNYLTNLCGAYEISKARMVFDTKLNESQVEECLKMFQKYEKVYYFNGWVYIKNFQKHQLNNPRVKAGIENGMKEVPEHILARIKNIEKLPEQIEKPQEITVPNYEPAPKEKAERFFVEEELQQTVIENLVDCGISADLAKQEIKKFVEYWTEKNGSGTKQRWQMEKVFEINKRLVTWFGRIKEFNQTKGKTEREVEKI